MKNTIVLFAIIVFGFPMIFGLSQFLENNQPALPAEVLEGDLLFKGEMLKKFSFGFDGLMADYYWMSALQYIGRKIVANGGLQNIQIDDLKPLNPRLLYPMLDTATTLDPKFTAVHSYGATVLPAINVEQAIKFAEKGIAAQPDNWLMYHHLGFIHWKNNEFKKAAEVYALGATKIGAPAWMKQMSANMEAQGGSRETARAMYWQIYETAQDEQTREIAAQRLLQIQSFDELDAIKNALKSFQVKENRCPQSWHEIFPLLQAAKLPSGNSLHFDAAYNPLDPSDAAYVLVNENGRCDVEINWQTSKVLRD